MDYNIRKELCQAVYYNLSPFHNFRVTYAPRRRKEYPLCHGYPWVDKYMRLPPGGGSAIGGGGACVCKNRNGVASSASFLPRSPSVTLRAPPPSQREARIPQPLGNRRCIFVTQQRREQAPALRLDGIIRRGGYPRPYAPTTKMPTKKPPFGGFFMLLTRLLGRPTEVLFYGRSRPP